MRRKSGETPSSLFCASQKEVVETSLPAHKLVSFSIDIHETPYVGCMCLTDQKEEQEQFLLGIEQF